MRLAGLALLLLISAADLFAQTGTECIGGKRYLIAFPDTIATVTDERHPHRMEDRAYLYVYSPVEAQVIMVNSMSGAVDTITVVAGDVATIELLSDLPFVDDSNRAIERHISLESDHDVTVYAYLATTFGAAAMTILPVERWGTEYVAALFPGEHVNDITRFDSRGFDLRPKGAPGQILIIAAHDDTEISISPSDSLADCPGCGQVRLDAGEAYLVESSTDTALISIEHVQPDIGGVRVVASKPIGVIAGNSRMRHQDFHGENLAENVFKDLTMEWLPPTEEFGVEFLVTPSWDRRRGSAELPEDEKRILEFVRAFRFNDTSGMRLTESKGSLGEHFVSPGGKSPGDFNSRQ